MKAYQLQNLRQIKVKYISPTNFRGSRVCIYEPKRYNNDKTKRIYLSYDYAIGNGTEQAIQYLQSKGINLLGKSNVKGETILFSDSWQKGNDDFITIKNK